MSNFFPGHRLPAAAIAGGVMTTALGLVAVFSRLLAPGYAFAVAAHNRLEGPSWRHLMGTDQLGRDLYTSVVQGAHTSVSIVAGVIVISTGIGLVAGVMAGSCGGLVDDAVMRVVDIVQSIPRFFLALLAARSFGAGVGPVTVVLGLTSWPLLARVVRAETLSLREQQFVAASRSQGASPARIVLRHVLPTVAPSALVVAALTGSRVVLLEAGLSFLGLSDPNVPSWGALLNNAEAYLSRAWWMAVFPGAAVLFSVLGMNLLSDGFAAHLQRLPTAGRAAASPVGDG